MRDTLIDAYVWSLGFKITTITPQMNGLTFQLENLSWWFLISSDYSRELDKN